jgi:hypothetical protein
MHPGKTCVVILLTAVALACVPYGAFAAEPQAAATAVNPDKPFVAE